MPEGDVQHSTPAVGRMSMQRRVTSRRRARTTSLRKGPAVPALTGAALSPRLPVSRELMFVFVGATSVVPLMKFTVTGFSFVCLALAILFTRRLENRGAGVPLLLAFAGTVAYVISSLVNMTSLLAPNVPAFAAFALYLCGLLIITSNLAELAAVLVGVACGTIGFYTVLGTALTSGEVVSALWKYGYAPAVTLLVLYAVARSRKRRPLLPCVAFVALAALSIVLNFRSHALICLAAALLLAVDHLRRRPTPLSVKVVMIAVVGGLVSSVLEYAARSGLLGGALTEKVEMQATQHVPSILVGRAEPPLSISAIIDHPLLGWGYANNISSHVFDTAHALATNIGFDSSYPFRYIWYLPDGSVSLHSILLGSWAEGGVVAVLLPAWLVWACLSLVRYAHRHPAWAALLTFLGIQGIWDLLFSPWSYNLPLVYAGISVAYLFIRADVSRSDRLPTSPPAADVATATAVIPEETATAEIVRSPYRHNDRIDIVVHGSEPTTNGHRHARGGGRVPVFVSEPSRRGRHAAPERSSP